MNEHLQNMLNIIQQSTHLNDEEKAALIIEVKATDKAFTITSFKLERTEKVKHTTAVLLEETIEELEQKRKAVEAQNRELAIESALERVRTRTMAMQCSEELQDVAMLLFQLVEELGIHSWSAGFNIWQQGNDAYIDWVTNPTGGFMEPYKVDLTSHPVFRAISDAKKSGVDFQVFETSGEALKETYALLLSFAPKQFQGIIASGIQFPERQINHYVFGSQVGLMFITPEPCPEAHDIYKRFGKVFDQTYTRFLDLQKAEAQAREAQIQLALERVRARTMAMQHSDELKDAAALLFQQVKSLGVPAYSCGYNIWEKDEKEFTSWMSTQDGSIINGVPNIPLTEDANFICYVESKENGEPFFVLELRGERMQEHYQYLKTIPAFKAYFDYAVSVGYDLPKTQIHHLVNFSQGNLLFITLEPCPEFHDVFKRFAAVFEQTYTRFLDLQKAEAQARESQIQLAMERVRARTMAMQKSDELAETAYVLFQQFNQLGENPDQITIGSINEEERVIELWLTMQGAQMNRSIKASIDEPILMHKMYTAWKEQKKSLVVDLAGQELHNYINFRNKLSENSNLPVVKNFSDERRVINVAFFSKGLITFSTAEPKPKETIELLERFASVFDLTYTRFIDLKNAEAQARESQIQLALERVRARTMAMQQSDELSDTAFILSKQVIDVGVKLWGNAFQIWDADKKAITSWTCTRGMMLPAFKIATTEDSIMVNILSASKRGENLYVEEMGGTALEDHYRYMISDPARAEVFKILAEEGNTPPTFQIFHAAYFTYGYILFITSEPCPEAYDIFKRFAKVFEQTYTRFLDLQKAEAQTLEAIKRASVDRVRAEIASMRTTQDLEKITPLIWNELTTLGIPFIRCGIFIMDEEKQQVQTMLSTPDGKAIATLHVPFAFDLSITTNAVRYWRKKEIYKEFWDTEAFTKAWIRLSSLSGTSMDATQVAHPPEGLHLHLLPFLQGMLYVGSEALLNEDQLILAQNLADAFSTAYARYEDFNKLEAAKQQVDKTLGELKDTQKQLIQSEKMASLGELTAGIAHEIQNPLNFVNNFSEVNKELISELVEEVDKGNTAEVKALANDIKANEEKINHHGKRADAIVKGMLQHSRSTSNTKESTDINALADEYLRLAYHGLRAKDKSFNATLKTDFDESIGKINIIPQDIGRVLLNLYNNAFYAVNPPSPVRSGAGGPKGGVLLKNEGRDPTVWVSTKKDGNSVLITVRDNGAGIPSNIVDKIFQPFFTTKPTGQGTGLGLSLSYDIVKAHGGDLKVETKENEGTAFIIHLPV